MKNTFLSTIDKLSLWSGKIFGFFVVVIACVATLETILRYFFNSPTDWGGELTIYLSGTLYIMGGAYVLKIKGHVVVDVLYNNFSLKIKSIIDLLKLPLLLILCIPLIIGGSEWAWTAIRDAKTSGTVWNPYIFPILVMIPLASSLFLLQGIADFIRDIQRLLRGGK